MCGTVDIMAYVPVGLCRKTFGALYALVPLIIVGIFGAVFTSASPSIAAKRERIEAFLGVTGFDVALDSIAHSAASAPVMLGLDIGVFGEGWVNLTEEVFDQKTMREMAIGILDSNLRDEALAHAAEFYASDLGQRLVAAENAAHMMESDTRKLEEGAVLVEEMLRSDGARLRYIQRMLAAIDGQDVAVKALQMIQLRFMLAAAAAGVFELPVDEEGLAAILKQQESLLRNTIRRNGLVSAAWVYRNFSDEEMLAYTVALEKSLMREVYELLNAVQYEITANRLENLARRMSEMMRRQDI